MTDLERRLVNDVTCGELLDLAGDGPVDEAAMRSWDNSRTVQASVPRDILRGRLAPDPDPHGLRLRGVRIAGRLDLNNLTTGVGVELSTACPARAWTHATRSCRFSDCLGAGWSTLTARRWTPIGLPLPS